MPSDLIWLVIAFPLAGAILLGVVGERLGDPLAGWLGTGTVVASFGLALALSVPFLAGTGHAEVTVLYEWIPTLGAGVEFLWDPLAALMTLVVTGIGGLIHLFSIGYMRGDARFGRFFTYLNLFVASMLILVLAANFAVLFVGWELVGLCSYLLISFWFTKPAAAAAGKKAFVVNRIGDFGFVVALMLIFGSFGTLSYADVLSDPAGVIGVGTATLIGLLLLLGATGKSAQLPLAVWLPDAMEGPTPVSALIHAATMVTAGVYMVARVSPIYELAPTASAVVLAVGTVTALFAATIALAQTDIKRVLAYSTISQLGYMFMAVGVAGYVAGIFHLTTHAFFKALLFLGAGSVMHSLRNTQELHRMGGLFRRMPVTAVTMAVGSLALAGVPPFSGFWSKDEVLGVVFQQGGWYYAAWGLGIATALLTGFYATRLFVLTFLGPRRWVAEAEPHESPTVMTVPLVVLAGGALLVGFSNTPIQVWLEHFLEPSFEGVAVTLPPEPPAFYALALVAFGAAAAGILIASALYLGPLEVRARLYRRALRSWELVRSGYLLDDAYGAAVVRPAHEAARWAAFSFDTGVVDGAANGIGRLVARFGHSLRPLQSGYVRNYALGIAGGALALLIWLIARGL